MNLQLSLTLAPAIDPFDLLVAPVLASEAFAELCRSLTKDRDILTAVAVRAEQLRATWDPSISPTAWAHALASDVVIERHRARREYEQQVVPLRENLYGAAMKLTRDPNDADDLVQDTMVRAWRFWASYRQGTDLKAWLFTVLRNTFINGYHRAGRKRDFQADVSEQMRSLGPTIAVANSGGAPAGPAEVVDAEQRRTAVHEALALLPDNYREAVTMCDLEGMHYREIAAALDIPIGTVMSRIFRGRRLLRTLLNAEIDG